MHQNKINCAVQLFFRKQSKPKEILSRDIYCFTHEGYKDTTSALFVCLLNPVQRDHTCKALCYHYYYYQYRFAVIIFIVSPYTYSTVEVKAHR